MSENFFNIGDTIISANTIVESLLVLSPSVSKRDLLPVLYKFPSFRSNTAKLIESIILHEKIFTLYVDQRRQELFEISRMSLLNEIIFSVPEHIMKPRIGKYVEDRMYPSKNIDPMRDQFKGALESSFFHAINKTYLPHLFEGKNIEINNLFHSIFPDNGSDRRAIIITSKEKQYGKLSPAYEKVKQAFIKSEEERISIEHGISYTSVFETEAKNGFDVYKDKSILLTVTEINKKNDKINAWLQNNYFTLTTPLVFDYVVQKANNNQSLLDIAFDIRNSKEATSFRNKCANFEVALKSEDKKQLSEMIVEVENAMKLFTSKYSAPPVNLDISFPLAATVNVREIKEFAQFKKRRHLVFLSRLYQSALESNHTMDKFVRLLG